MKNMNLFEFLGEVKERVENELRNKNMYAASDVTPAIRDGETKWGISVRGPVNAAGVFEELESYYEKLYCKAEGNEEEIINRCVEEVLDSYDEDRKPFTYEQVAVMFLEQLMEPLQNKMKAAGYDRELKIVERIKRGVKRIDLSIFNPDSNVGMHWAARKDLVEDYYCGPHEPNAVISYCVHEVMEEIGRGEPSVDMEHIRKISEYEMVKEFIMPVLCPKDRWSDFLSDAPYREVLDLALCYRVDVKGIWDIGGTLYIENKEREMWDVDEETLYRQAMKNMKEKACCESMNQVLERMMGQNPFKEESGEEMNLCMYVLSTPDKHCGAASILQEECLKELASKLGTDRLYIIPSSLHECLLVDAKSMDPDFLKYEISKVNKTQVSEEDFLSDSLYIYDTEKGYLIYGK